mmetsp:Transcript_40699/g.105641  ORF Transcript_40699/g.105641 Transcript_40699/m.105641 type:complete len:148 (+) Transcript_40699:3054-3497(+)
MEHVGDILSFFLNPSVRCFFFFFLFSLFSHKNNGKGTKKQSGKNKEIVFFPQRSNADGFCPQTAQTTSLPRLRSKPFASNVDHNKMGLFAKQTTRSLLCMGGVSHSPFMFPMGVLSEPKQTSSIPTTKTKQPVPQTHSCAFRFFPLL